MSGISVFWFRRDLRLEDNAGLFHALHSGLPVLPVFIFDKNILDKLENGSDPRVHFIMTALAELRKELKQKGSDIFLIYGEPSEAWKTIVQRFPVKKVFANSDYEPYARERDRKVKEMLAQNGIEFGTFKDHVIFEKGEVVKRDGSPYTVFTPYSRAWMEKLMHHPANREENSFAGLFHFRPFPSSESLSNLFPFTGEDFTLKNIGFKESQISFPAKNVSLEVIRNYHHTRDFPAIDGTSRLGIHFRFGTISIRDKAAVAFSLNPVFLKELIWRDFYAMILWHFPHVAERSFRPEYDYIPWKNGEADFQRWCEGRTGYPIVDAGMRELSATGYMHNRVRMITASFLVKHLLIDWRWGEAWFAEKLLDYDLASNNGGWQWAAGSGTDAAPYFRIFNPVLQQQKFDRDLEYVKWWVPEYGTEDYPEPVVEHAFARERCLKAFQSALKNNDFRKIPTD